MAMETVSKVKIASTNPDFVAVNREILTDNVLSFEAIGVLVYLLAQEEMDVNPKNLMDSRKNTAKTTGVYSIYRVLRELQMKGFASRWKNRGMVRYTVSDSPLFNAAATKTTTALNAGK